jgi:hypothetical protein
MTKPHNQAILLLIFHLLVGYLPRGPFGRHLFMQTRMKLGLSYQDQHRLEVTQNA